MKTPQKSNEDIRSDGDAFIDAYLRARDELGRLDGVVAVGFGRKEVVDKLTADLSITAFVLEKIPDSEIPPDQQVPPTFEGYRTDVRVVPDITPAKCDNEDKYDSIEGGIQIQARNENSSFSGDDGKGTLGCIVRKRGNDKFKNHYLLTADHVLNTDNARRGGLVHHPYAPPAGDTTGSQVIAFIEDYGWRESVDYTAHRPSGEEFPMSGYIDCGIARLDLESRCCGIACSADNVQFDTTITDLDPDDATNNTIADVRDLSLDFAIAMPLDDIGTATDANRVVKVGRTTGRTVGIVTAVNSAALDGGDIIAGLLEVEFDPASTTDGVNCKGNALFIEGGDSGALVLDMNNNAVGLAFGTKTRPDDGRISCFACHIVAVLDTLRISIPTTGGTSHGSTLATDGSGIARYGGSIADVSDSGNVLFSSQAVAGTLKSASPAYPPRELQLVEDFVNRLRETRDGQFLHDAYVRSIREIGYLIRNKRQVMVTWHRNKGPAFLAAIADHLRGIATSIPVEIDGISRTTMLTNLERVLLEHGSRELRDTIESQRDAVMRCNEATTAEECIRILGYAETEAIA